MNVKAEKLIFNEKSDNIQITFLKFNNSLYLIIIYTHRAGELSFGQYFNLKKEIN